MANENSVDWPEVAEQLSLRFGGMTTQVLGGLKHLLTTGKELVQCAESALMVPANDTHLQFLVSASSTSEIADALQEVRVPVSSSLSGYVFNTGQMVAVANPEDFYQGVDEKTGLETNIYLAAPVVDGEEVLGVITFLNRPEGTPPDLFNEHELEVGQQMGRFAAAGLRYYNRLRLQEQLFVEEFHRTAQQIMGQSVPGGAFPEISSDLLEVAPLAGVLTQWERLSPGQQTLAAEMIDLLLRHGDLGRD